VIGSFALVAGNIAAIDLIAMSMRRNTGMDRPKNVRNHRSTYFVVSSLGVDRREQSASFSSKRRRNDDVQRSKKPIDDEIEEGETTGNDTLTVNGDGHAASAPKRVPLSLEEMLERNKKEQEAIAKVSISYAY
jgi:hypothetical protein